MCPKSISIPENDQSLALSTSELSKQAFGHKFWALLNHMSDFHCGSTLVLQLSAQTEIETLWQHPLTLSARGIHSTVVRRMCLAPNPVSAEVRASLRWQRQSEQGQTCCHERQSHTRHRHLALRSCTVKLDDVPSCTGRQTWWYYSSRQGSERDWWRLWWQRGVYIINEARHLRRQLTTTN